VRWNKVGEATIGFFREELIGKTDYDVFPKEEAISLPPKTARL